jgi:putative component of membrane protein insertase Oxa1/YidC/SpoIIIJ protein YidD
MERTVDRNGFLKKVLLLFLIFFFSSSLFSQEVPLVLFEPSLFSVREGKTPLESFVTPFFLLYSGFITKGNGPTCIYYPTCAGYTEKAIRKYGVIGIFMGISRIMSDHTPREGDRFLYLGERLYIYDPPEDHYLFSEKKRDSFHWKGVR